MTDIPLTAVHALFITGTCPVHVSSAIVATGLTFCSVTVVAAIGWGGAAACALAVCVHLTLLPALLVVLGPCCCMPLVNCRCTSEVCVALCRAVCAVGAPRMVRVVAAGVRWVRGGRVWCRGLGQRTCRVLRAAAGAG